MNICKDCGSELIESGFHEEAHDYRRWICPKCDNQEILKC